jgi:hypothetical protein
MSTLQNKITQTNTAYIDTAAYQKSAADYMTIYEVWQRGDKNAATSTAETAMKTAKQKAVASNQTLFGSTSTNFNEFTQQTTESSTETVQKNSDTQTKKGFTSNCSYTRDGSLSQQLCSAQSIERNYKTSLDACIASQQNIGG